MRKIVIPTVLLALSGAMAFGADDHPTVETFLGYTYLRANSATDIPAFSMNGGTGQLAVNFNKWIGFVMDVGAVHNGNISDVHLDGTFVDYVFGPRISLRYHRITPFFNIMFGAMRASESIQVSAIPIPPSASQPIFLPGQTTPVPPNTPVSLRAVHSQTAFAMPLGGGLDIRINKYMSFRPIELEWFMTRLQNIRDLNDRNQHHLRYMTGINFTFGAQ